MIEKIEHYPKYVPIVSIPMPEFLDVLNTLNATEDALDIEIDIGRDTALDTLKLVEQIVPNVRREYYRKVVKKWLQKFDEQTAMEQD